MVDERHLTRKTDNFKVYPIRKANSNITLMSLACAQLPAKMREPDNTSGAQIKVNSQRSV